MNPEEKKNKIQIPVSQKSKSNTTLPWRKPVSFLGLKGFNPKMQKCGLALASLIVTLISVASVNGLTDYNANGIDCWEVCYLDAFQESDGKGEQKRLQEFLKLINKVKELRIKHQVPNFIIEMAIKLLPIVTKHQVKLKLHQTSGITKYQVKLKWPSSKFYLGFRLERVIAPSFHPSNKRQKAIL